MKVTREFCDVCRTRIKGDRMTLSLSMGAGDEVGWGRLRHLINWRGTLCTHCYDVLGTDIALAWRGRFDELREPETVMNAAEIPDARVGQSSKPAWRQRALRRIEKCLARLH